MAFADRLICAFLLPALCTAFAPPSHLPAPAAQWIASRCVDPDGAITVRPRGHRVSGYFGNLTALGLAVSGNEPRVVLGWLRWYTYRARLSRDGVPDDIAWSAPGKVAERTRPDSTDAYPATFLMVAWAAYQSNTATLRDFVTRHRMEIERIARSSVATQQPTGLTWARPGHHVAYAIDNAQVYRGLLDGAALARAAYHDTGFSNTLLRDARRVRRGMMRYLWNPKVQAFRPFIGERLGNPYPEADLRIPYPDALAQVAAVLYGILPRTSPTASTLLDRTMPALDAIAPSSDAFEFTLMYAAARRHIGRPIARIAFSPMPLCSDAGWELLLRH